MRRRRFVLIGLAIAAAVRPAAAATHPPGETKTDAEVNVLRVVAHSWTPSRIPDLVDPRTHLLANNTEAICRGRGRPQAASRYARFVCVVQPRIQRSRQGLYVRYRALPGGRFRIHWLGYRRS